MRHTKKIDLNTELFEGDIIYAPSLQKYFQIEDVGFNKFYNAHIVNLKPENNFEDGGFTIRFSGLIYLKFQVVVN
jgi:hypothetical protein